MVMQVLRCFAFCSENVIWHNASVLNGRQKDSRYFFQVRHKFGAPKLTPQQVNTILRVNEIQVSLQSSHNSVRSYDSNQLPSNNPIEDRRAEARCLQTTGMFFGVFDGHGGPACAEVVSRRLFTYLAAALLPATMLKDTIASLRGSGNDVVSLLEWYDATSVDGGVSGDTSCRLAALPATMSALYRASHLSYCEQLLTENENLKEFQMADVLARVFLHLDRDVSCEAEMQHPIDLKRPLLSQTLAVAMSGCVACVVHVDGPHLHVANTGDSAAVLGTLSESNAWVAKPLSRAHNVENVEEVRRIGAEHPSNEASTVLKQERLLGQLAPLRSFGDFRFKWALPLQNQLLVPLFGHKVLPPNYYTPPYLTARPDVQHHRLLPRDKFMVIASDGLWDVLTPSRVVQLVGEYMQGRQTLEPFRLPHVGRQQKPVTLGEISDVLAQRSAGLHHTPVDSNAATHLIRSALGGTEYGIDHTVLSEMLSAPEDVVRFLRDDITVTIVFFDTDYLRHCPA